VKAWELENKFCEHSRNYPGGLKKVFAQELKKCSECDLKSNLWLCLECGNVGCGRKYHDGTGGNNHGISHY